VDENQDPNDPLAAVNAENQRQQDELEREQQIAFEQMRLSRQQQPKGGLNSNSSSMDPQQFMSPAAGGLGGFTGASAPAIGAGTGEGATGLFGLGGGAEMAGGSTGSGLFTLGGASEGVGAGSAGMFSMGGGAAAGGAAAEGGGAALGGGGAAMGGSGMMGSMSAAGPWAALAAVVLLHNKWAVDHDIHKNSDFFTQQGPAKDGRYYATKMNKIIPGWGTDAKVWGDLSSFRVGSAIKDWKHNPLGPIGGLFGMGKD
jgi:hypothetical protein